MIRGFGARGTLAPMTPQVRENLKDLLMARLEQAQEADAQNKFVLADCHRHHAAIIRQQLEASDER